MRFVGRLSEQSASQLICYQGNMKHYETPKTNLKNEQHLQVLGIRVQAVLVAHESTP